MQGEGLVCIEFTYEYDDGSKKLITSCACPEGYEYDRPSNACVPTDGPSPTGAPALLRLHAGAQRRP